jgi:hypothetical protein
VPPLDANWIAATYVPYLALAGIGIGLLGLFVGGIAHLRVRRLRSAYRLLQGDATHEDLVTAVGRKVAEVAALRTQFEHLRAEAETTRAAVSDALCRVSVIRYDAFGDMGGRLSFSAALLSDAGDGVVFTAINGRQETRTYAKGVRGGRSDCQLSPEEQRAVTQALQGHASVTLPVTAEPAHTR